MHSMTTAQKASSIKHLYARKTMSKTTASVAASALFVLAGCGGAGADTDTDTLGRGVIVGSAPGTTLPSSVVDLPTTSVPVSIYEDKTISNAEASSLVGLKEAEALREAQDRGWRVRVVGRDGELYAVTMDYSAGRLNFTIVNGVVSASTVG